MRVSNNERVLVAILPIAGIGQTARKQTFWRTDPKSWATAELVLTKRISSLKTYRIVHRGKSASSE
jgi:hypothetical protein